MPPRAFLSLASLAFVAVGASAALAAPPLPPPASSPPPASPATPAAAPDAASAPAAAPAPATPAPAPDSISAPPPLAAPPPAPPGAAPPPWMWRPPPPAYGLYPGWRLEEDRPSKETDARTWYGWQSLIGVIPSHALFAFSTFDNDLEFLMVAGVLGHCLTSPIVHWAHGNVGRGFLSLGLNATLPLAGMALAFETGSTEMLIAAGLITIVGWPIVDTVALSYEEAPKSKDKSTSLIHSFGVVPMIDSDTKGLSLVGQF
ncbi:hypothetical protein [Polyangium jinanense]|uniref:Uncharacterized protein n=1 Tax=Polyangium jinanense TaxID=2829994 RepID=A0A9X3X5W4_9BACT|nr:hypothetical protein [Polyangium jinanense]MDC3954336.1 hypothetical protein [Polyangium jinanense]MDC3984212.1 hypothetical protein [Polyangium jinanense]